jgi:hypothetical protein
MVMIQVKRIMGAHAQQQGARNDDDSFHKVFEGEFSPGLPIHMADNK